MLSNTFENLRHVQVLNGTWGADKQLWLIAIPDVHVSTWCESAAQPPSHGCSLPVTVKSKLWLKYSV